jgi:NAD(P)H-dependent flavin oxidoreductase YrpB (nitropropane dioxygenase family)
VSNAGALGMISLTWSDPDEIDTMIAEMRALSDRPFGVNLILEWPQEERLRRIVGLGVPIVSLFWGDPSPLVPIAHAAGALVMHTVGSAEEARRVVDAGVDVVVAQGWEAGGHVWGSVALLPLIPAIVDVVGSVPVVAAGGVGDGRGLAAVLALGGAGVWLGTRFVMASETRAHPRYQELLAAASETSTVHSNAFDGGWPAATGRTLRNTTIESWEAAGRPTKDRPGEGDIVATWRDGEPILRYESAAPVDTIVGDIEALSMWAGQSVGLVRDIQPATEIVRRIADEARAALDDARSAVRE